MSTDDMDSMIRQLAIKDASIKMLQDEVRSYQARLDKCRAACEDEYGCCVLCHYDISRYGHSENCGLFVESPGAQESREPELQNSGTGFVKSEPISNTLGLDAYWVGWPRK